MKSWCFSLVFAVLAANLGVGQAFGLDRGSFEMPSESVISQARKSLQLFWQVPEARWAKVTSQAFYSEALKYDSQGAVDMTGIFLADLMGLLSPSIPEEQIEEFADLRRRLEREPKRKEILRLQEILVEALSNEDKEKLHILAGEFLEASRKITDDADYHRNALYLSIVGGFGLALTGELAGRALWAGLVNLHGLVVQRGLLRLIDWVKKRDKRKKKASKAKKTKPEIEILEEELEEVEGVVCKQKLRSFVAGMIKRPSFKGSAKHIGFRLPGIVSAGVLSYLFYFYPRQPWIEAENQVDDHIIPLLEFDLQPVE